MVNPINRSIKNTYQQTGERKRNLKEEEKNKAISGGVIVNISNAQLAEEQSIKNKVETIKTLLKEGKYPLNREKVAETILKFLTDVG